MKIAYFVNQYPKVSHSFIRREILALERQGMEVARYALRGWDADVVDPEDVRERQQTSFVLKGGVVPLLTAIARLALRHPLAFIAGLHAAVRLSRGGDRTLAHHLVSLGEAAMVTAWARRDGVAHLHAHFGTNSAEVALLARTIGGPRYSFTVHGPDEWDQPRQHKLREKIDAAEFVVGISAFTRSQLSRWAQEPDRKKLHVVHCGLEPAFHHGPPSPVPDNCRLVCVGRLCRDKAQVPLVEAVGQLKREGVRVELVLAGDGDARVDVERVIVRHNVQDQVRITGWISGARVREEILAARALVLPSYAEGLPVVIMEALALRRPVITTWVAGIPELVRNGLEGWLIAPGSVGSIAQAIRACLETPVAQLQDMGERGRLRVLERHDVNKEASKLIALFKEAEE